MSSQTTTTPTTTDSTEYPLTGTAQGDADITALTEYQFALARNDGGAERLIEFFKTNDRTDLVEAAARIKSDIDGDFPTEVDFVVATGTVDGQSNEDDDDEEDEVEGDASECAMTEVQRVGYAAEVVDIYTACEIELRKVSELGYRASTLNHLKMQKRDERDLKLAKLLLDVLGLDESAIKSTAYETAKNTEASN